MPLSPSTQAPATDSLFVAQTRLFGHGEPLTVIDAGAHHGHTSIEYLDAFPNCRVIALEPAPENHAAAATALAPFGARAELLKLGLSDADGTADLLLTSHSGSHSLLPVGDVRFFDAPIEALPPERIATVTIDRLCADRGIATLDVLKMDIQGGELMALRGASGMLSRGAIRAVVLEVLFHELYRGAPTFWDLANHLRQQGYALQGIYDYRYQPGRPATLCWADAIFVSPDMAKLPK